jgi:hypothetical protein
MKRLAAQPNTPGNPKSPSQDPKRPKTGSFEGLVDELRMAGDEGADHSAV